MNRKRLLAAVMYIAVIVFVYAYIFITGGMFVNADGVANAHYQAYNIEKPSIVATDESLGRIDVYAAGKGNITAFRIDKDSSIYARGFMVDGGVIATDDNVGGAFLRGHRRRARGLRHTGRGGGALRALHPRHDGQL